MRLTGRSMIDPKNFKFKISRQRSPANPYDYSLAHIVMTAPHLYMRWNMSNHLADEDAIRLMKLELKQELIKAILDGEWEIE